MNTKDLLYFRKLVETKSFTQTAEYFKLSQPSITAAVQRLTKEFDSKLIYQKSRRSRIIITPAGEVLYERSKNLDNLLQMTKNEVYRANDAKLKIGISPVVGKIFLPQILKKLQKEHLRQRVILSEDGSTKILSDLDEGLLDIGLINVLNPKNNQAFKSKVLRVNKVNLIVAANSDLANKKEINFSKLNNKQFVTMNQQFIHRMIFNHYCQVTGIHPKLAYVTNNISILLELVRNNIGIALVTDKAAEGIKGIKSIKVSDVPPMSTYTILIMRADTPMTLKQKAVINALEAVQD